ncbi:MAG: ATP-dependent Clp protease ATP-binding subunit [Alphaproteobacteria bacterium]|nr:ATP-dependent Clp protease ATP-binding subunit [Alphaproteobacteria bacterium]
MLDKNDTQPKNLTDFELNDLIDKYYNQCVSFLTPVGIECLLIAFSPAVAEHIKNTTGENATQIQQEMKCALDGFRTKHYFPKVYLGIDYLDDEQHFVDYAAILKPKSDIQRLIACFQNRNRDTDTFGADILEFCNPVLERYNLSFEKLFPEEYEKSKQKFTWNLPDASTQQKTTPIDFGTDLTEEVQDLTEPPIFNRDKELKLLENLLLKQNRSNVMLIGKNGTGKSVLVEGLAYNIVNGLCHPLLRGTKIISINFGDLMSNTTFRGELESKLIELMENIADNNSILFLDEIHTLFSNRGSNEKIADIMKPYLANGEIRMIGATTDKEFLSIRDDAFLRRFNQITLSEPSIETTLDILKKLKPGYEESYSVSISDEVLADIVQKASLYIHNRHFPDKAIDLLNYVCVLASKNKQHAQCTIDLTNKALVDMFNIPLALLNTSKATQIQTLHTKLNNKIFGQQPAIEAISTTLTHSYIMHTNKTPSPQASFLFCGPSGVGKTKTAEEIAKLLGRGFSVINMNEYQNEIDVQKLTGAAPGYIGYESGGQLTNIIAQNPYSVLLFDEFEKAHKNVQRLLLQILDKGTFTDNQGMTLSFNNTIIIMATNAGVQRDAKIGFDEQKTKLSVSHDNLSKVFLPEFLGRVNQIVTFEPLSQAALQQITNTLCHELNATIEQDYNISVSVNPAVQDFVIKKGYRPELGARIIKNTFQREVEVPVAYEITANHKTLADTKKRAQMTVDLINNKVVCKTIQK